VIVPFVLTLIAMLVLYNQAIGNLGIALMMTLIMAAASFVFSAVAGYMAGIVGSSSNPVSGVTIATVALSAVLLMLVMGSHDSAGPAAALMIGAVVCCAAAMGGDNLQDLKTGHIVGATPWKQQVMQVVGVATGALVIAPVLTLLQRKYGLGELTVEHPHPLTAPQATLMASLANGVFGGTLPWGMIALGAVIAVLVIAWEPPSTTGWKRFSYPGSGVCSRSLPADKTQRRNFGGWPRRRPRQTKRQGASGAGEPSGPALCRRLSHRGSLNGDSTRGSYRPQRPVAFRES
jgi:putative OPT family oligopeptide transporter